MNKPNRLLSLCLSMSLLFGSLPLSAAAEKPETPVSALQSSQEQTAAPDAAVPQQITGITVTADPKVYNGETDDPVLHVTFEGVDPQPALEDYRLTGSYSSFHVTRDEAPNVTAELTLTEAGLQKYALAQDVPTQYSIYGAITPARLTVTALDQSIPQDGSPDLTASAASATVTTGETVTLQSLTITLQGDSLIPSGAAVKVEKGTRDTTGNYEIHYVNGTLTRQSAALSSAPGAKKDLVYNGKGQNLITPGQAQNGQMVYYAEKKGAEPKAAPQWASAIPQGKDAGVYVVHYMAKGEPGYTDSPEGTLEVTLGQMPVVLSGTVTKVYDGTGSVPKNTDGYDVIENLKPVSGSFLESDVKVLGVKGSSFKEGHWGAGDNRAVVPGNIHLSGSGENYLVTMEITGTVTKKPITVTLGGEKAYGQKDPEAPYTAEGLLKGDSLQGKVTREAGEAPGAYAYDGSGLQSPDYAITLKPGKLTVKPARIELRVKPSSASVNPGKTLTLQIGLRNGEKDLMDSGWDQPQGLRLKLGRQELKLTKDSKDPTLFTASCTVPKDSTGSLRFLAESTDKSGNYRSATLETTVKISIPSDNPQTSDSRNPGLYLAVAGISGTGLLAMAAVLLLNRKKR